MSVHTFVSVYYAMFGKKIPGEQNIPQNVQAWQLEKENTFDPRTLEGGYYKQWRAQDLKVVYSKIQNAKQNGYFIPIIRIYTFSILLNTID